MVEEESRHHVKVLPFEKGGEFTSIAFHRYLSTLGIQRELANTGTPSEIEVVERKNCTLVEMARTMLTHHNLPPFLLGKPLLLLFTSRMDPRLLLFLR